VDWKNIVNLECLHFEPGDPKDSYMYDVAPAASASAMGAKKLGWNVSILRPGQFSCPYHFHHSEEELFIVLEGKAMLRQADRFREVSKGDLIFFANSPEGAHQLYNHTDQPFRYFALSNCNDDLEVAEYPDSKKVIVRKIRKLFEAATAVEYYKGEEDPSKFWPKEHIRPNESGPKPLT
jgi:uncharacterized cupin superfamily protein